MEEMDRKDDKGTEERRKGSQRESEGGKRKMKKANEMGMRHLLLIPDCKVQGLKWRVKEDGHNKCTCSLVWAFCTTSLATLMRGVRMARVKSVTLIPCKWHTFWAAGRREGA